MRRPAAGAAACSTPSIPTVVAAGSRATGAEATPGAVLGADGAAEPTAGALTSGLEQAAASSAKGSS